MIPIDGQPILTVAEMRAAEEAAIAAGSSVEELMERAGAGVAEAVRRLAAGAPVLILCGSGNNGGDGYVAARILKANGVDVRVAASDAPRSPAAIAAARGWTGGVETLDQAVVAPVIVDAVLGTGLNRDVDDAARIALQRFASGFKQPQLRIAVDIPSGLDADTGEMRIASLTRFDLTLALGALKPVHVLARSSDICGTVRVVDIGVPAASDCRVIGRPILDVPGCGESKYTRGMAVVIAGAMPGAAALAAEAVLRAGAGYCLMLTDAPVSGVPHAIVQRTWAPDALDDPRIGSIVVGPGLGRDDAARRKLDAALATDKTVVIDGDALHLLAGHDFYDRDAPTIVTPHAGEFKAVFGEPRVSKIDAARAAAMSSGAVVVFKGADTVIADTNGAVTVSPGGPGWLSTAGTGDVLAGVVGAMASVRRTMFWMSHPRPVGEGELAEVATAVWLHAEAARRLGGAFIADDLARELSAVRSTL